MGVCAEYLAASGAIERKTYGLAAKAEKYIEENISRRITVKELAERLGDLPFAARLKKAKKDLTETVNRTAFNGDYYVRALSKFGTVGDKGQPGGAIRCWNTSWPTCG